MALILVVEPEDRYVQRIRDALSSEGWQVRVVRGADEALSAAETEPPQLVLVNRQADKAERLFEAFARRTGGPGVVALLPENAIHLADPMADEALAKPFTDQDLRLAVRRGLHGNSSEESGSDDRPSPAAAPAAERRLTTQDIFGDLVAEVESEIQGEDPAPSPPSPPSPAAAPPAPSQPTSPSRPSFDDDLDLEQTLSGLRRDFLIDSRPSKPREGPPAAPPAAERTVRSEPPNESPRRSRISDDLDIDALLSETLSGLALSSKRKKKAEDTPAPSPPSEAAAPAPTEEPGSEEVSFADLSAPSVQEVPDPTPSATGATTGTTTGESLGESLGESSAESLGEIDEEEIEVDLEMELEDEEFPSVELHAEPEDHEPSEPAAVSLDDLLESDEEPMVEVEEPRPELAAARAHGDASEPEGRDEGQRFGPYTLLDRIAVGGMAEVWKARMSGVEGFQKTVAIKKILPHLTDNDDFVDMFIDEAKLAAQLSHPNIIHIYALGKIGDHFYIAMEYVEGKNLRALLNESRKKALPLPRGLAVLIAARLASALDHAHRKKDFEDRELGLVHRDVSPQNVLISDEGDIKLCDFGIVKAVSKASQTQMGALKGKLQYMSPEQAWGKDVDARSDLFSLGAILFEMLTGRRLFVGDNEISVLEAVRQCQVVAPRDLVPQIPEEVERIALKALEMDPERRYQSAGKLQQELESVLYSVKPALGPADLAEYLERLAAASEVDGAEAAAVSAPAPTADSKPVSSPAAEIPPEPAAAARSSEPQTGSHTGSRPRPPTQTGTPTQTDSPTQTGSHTASAEVVQAVSGTALADLDEGGGLGRLWLWVLIGLLVVAGAAVTYYLYFVRPGATDSATEVEEPAANEATEPMPASPLDEMEPEDGEGEESALDDGGLDEPAEEEEEAAEAEPPEETAEAATRSPDRPNESQPAAAATAATAIPTATTAAAQPEPPREAQAQTPKPTTEPAPRAPTEAPAQSVEAPTREPNPREPESPVSTETADDASESESDSEPDSESDSEPMETVDVTEPVPAAEPESDPRAETERPETPRLRPTEPKPEPPPQPPPDPEVREGDLVGVGPGVKAPVLVRFDKPSYPPIARRMRAEGEVVLSLLVDENGRVIETRLIQGVREGVGLNEAALEAARRARYEPATKNGVRVKMWTTLKIPFRLAQ